MQKCYNNSIEKIEKVLSDVKQDCGLTNCIQYLKKLLAKGELDDFDYCLIEYCNTIYEFDKTLKELGEI